MNGESGRSRTRPWRQAFGGDDVVGGATRRVTQYRAGKMQTFGFLVGQVMKGSNRKADPKLGNDLLKRELEGV